MYKIIIVISITCNDDNFNDNNSSYMYNMFKNMFLYAVFLFLIICMYDMYSYYQMYTVCNNIFDNINYYM